MQQKHNRRNYPKVLLKQDEEQWREDRVIFEQKEPADGFCT